MNSADLIELAAFGFGAWVAGYVLGFMFWTFRRFTEKI